MTKVTQSADDPKRAKVDKIIAPSSHQDARYIVNKLAKVIKAKGSQPMSRNSAKKQCRTATTISSSSHGVQNPGDRT